MLLTEFVAWYLEGIEYIELHSNLSITVTLGTMLYRGGLLIEVGGALGLY